MNTKIDLNLSIELKKHNSTSGHEIGSHSYYSKKPNKHSKSIVDSKLLEKNKSNLNKDLPLTQPDIYQKTSSVEIVDFDYSQL